MLLLQVEYSPCVVFADCWALIREFIQSFVTCSVPEQPTLTNVKIDAYYTPKDTAMQYYEHFNALRKSDTAPQQTLQQPSQIATTKS